MLESQKFLDYQEMRSMRNRIKGFEILRKTAEQLAKENVPEQERKRQSLER